MNMVIIPDHRTMLKNFGLKKALYMWTGLVPPDVISEASIALEWLSNAAAVTEKRISEDELKMNWQSEQETVNITNSRETYMRQVKMTFS